jgi:transcriptional regulator with XRE-family HTH domain
MQHSSSQISFLRSTLRLTREKFAKEIGYSASYVKDIESGRVKPSRGFLEALSLRYGVSIDSLLSDFGAQVVSILDRIPTFSDYGFVYLYDFNDRGLDEAEKQLLEFLSGRPHILIDCRTLRSPNHLYSMLTGAKGTTHELYHLLVKKTPAEDFRYVVLRSFSLFKGRDPGRLRDLAKIITPPFGALILIDKPSYLERHAQMLYYWAFPMHFSHWGRMHAPYSLFYCKKCRTDGHLDSTGRPFCPACKSYIEIRSQQ